MMLEIIDASVGYGAKIVSQHISLQIRTGEICCILGPNGVGKTTLFKTILGSLRLMSGKILVDGEEISKCPPKKLSRIFGYVPQEHVPPFPYRVIDVVLMGRTAHLGMFSAPSKRDAEIADNALKALDAGYLRESIYTEISGGERQLVLIARALAQEPAFLMLDEPTSSLDYGNQVRVLRRVAELAKRGLGVIMITHSPDHTLQLNCQVALLQRGGFCFGPAKEIVSEGNLKSAYGIDVRIVNVITESDTFKTCTPVLN